MGNGIGKLGICFSGAVGARRRHDMAVVISDPLDEGLGHSFCYVRPDPSRLLSSKVHSEETTTFRSISGASVSANTSTPLSTAFVDLYSYNSLDRAAAFESSTSFASIPLQPVPRCLMNSGSLSGNFGGILGSGSLERGFLSGPIERGFMSGPLDRGLFSSPLEKGSDKFQRSFSHGGFAFGSKSKKGSLVQVLRRAIVKTMSRGQNSVVAPVKGVVSVKESDWVVGSEKNGENLTVSSANFSSEMSLDDDFSFESQNLQWAQGKAGEDRVHIVISEEHGWVFVGIYDGFNGPDAPDYLLSNLYSSVHKELKGLLWDDKHKSSAASAAAILSPLMDFKLEKEVSFQIDESDHIRQGNSQCVEPDSCSSGSGDFNSNSNKKRKSRNSKNRLKGAAKKWEENQRRWKCEWDRERLELERRLKEQLSRSGSEGSAIDHSDVLKALSRALRKTEEAYLEIADKMVTENPELALMGSCVLVMLMKGEDVYLMNVGDSRAVLAQKSEPDLWLGDLERIKEETLHDLETSDGDQPNLRALQLTLDHSTCVEEVMTFSSSLLFRSLR